MLPVGVGTPAGALASPTKFEPPADVSMASASSSQNDDDDIEGEEGYPPLELLDALRLVDELVGALSTFHDDSMVDTYGAFVACLISLQKVFQRPDWGYAEWPDVVAVLNEHSGDPEYDDKWATLLNELSRRGFPSIPIFNGGMSREELIAVMREMVTASKQVAQAVGTLKTTGDKVIHAHHTFVTQQSREAYYAWRDLCPEAEFKIIESVAEFGKASSDGGAEVVVPAATLKKWKDSYLVRALLDMMAPLTKLQEANMCKYGIGATHFHNLVSKYADDEVVSSIAKQLEELMALIHPPPPPSESDSSDYSSSGGENDSGEETTGDEASDAE